ncbi:hypothetical protein SDC9_152288 [bioreactor metagenome]|uniref:Uncharacterized protein n=1 Tax=bioreactor metagenome TaxID=1076179 RepID=A0A645ESP3_9ZZZZ
MLAVLIQRGGADDLQLAARECRLEDVGRVHRRTGGTGPHQHVQLINEEDGFGSLEFINDAFEALFKLAAVHGTRNQRTYIQLQNSFANEGSGHIPFCDALGQPFYDGGLANTRLTNEGGVVLVAAGQDLDDTLDLVLASHHRVQLAFFGQGG